MFLNIMFKFLYFLVSLVNLIGHAKDVSASLLIIGFQVFYMLQRLC